MASNEGLNRLVQGWLGAFESALSDGSASELEPLFEDPCYWRDQIALSWNMQQFSGRLSVTAAIAQAVAMTGPFGFMLDLERPAPLAIQSADKDLIEAYFRFVMPHGTGQGMVRLSVDPGSPIGVRCFALGTDLCSLNGVTEAKANVVTRERITPIFPIHGYKPMYKGQQFAEYLRDKQAFADSDPDVLIIGGGHTGMCVGARLDRMGQSYLIVDRGEKVGESWRNRYESLALHTIGATNQMPYIRSPEIFPDYIPKDVWADWIEAYAKLMQLNMWMKTEVASGRFDESKGEWAIELKLADGSTRTMRPKHIVLATGGIGLNPIPFKFAGLDNFKGTVVHSKYYKTGADFAGQTVLVAGCGTSAFDMCYDLHLKGARPIMLQRSETSVVPLEEGVRYNRDYLPGADRMDQETADLRRGVGAIFPLMIEILKQETRACNERNAQLYADLRKAGLWLGDGTDGTGWLGKLFKTFKGFHLDMGVLKHIVAGDVKIQQAAEVECFVEHGIRLKDGTVIDIDAVVAATGFQNANENVAELFGDEIAAKVGPCAGLDEAGEPIGLAKPLAQRQFWQLYGGVNDCRRLSRHIAFQIIAQLRGIVPPLERQEDGSVRGGNLTPQTA